MMLRALALLIAVALVLPSSAQGASTRAVDLAKERTVTAIGGHEVAGVGDVNGEGTPDWAVGSPARGMTYVVFGEYAKGRVDLSDLGDAGFAIEAANAQDHASRIAGAGDVNGDGLGDLIVGAPGSDPLQRASAGSAYVVFGKASRDTVELSHFDLNIQGDAGFRIMGGSARGFAGEDVSSAGDVNADGYDDVLVGAVFRGATYVVFGKDSSLPIDLLTFDMGEQGSQGYVIETPAPEYNDLYSVSGGLDVNGDGIPDPTVGVIRKHGGRGSVYVTFGQSSSTDAVEVRDLGDEGFRITGTRRSGAGYALAQVGDFNGDDRAETLIGAPGFAPDGSRGSAYLVFGRSKSGTIRLAKLRRRGFRIDGTDKKTSFGISVAATADMNGDGRADLLVGAPVASPLRRAYAGAAYVIYGKRRHEKVVISELGGKGMRIAGSSAEEYAGWSVASAGVHPDHGPTILVGAPAGEDSVAGAVYVAHPNIP